MTKSTLELTDTSLKPSRTIYKVCALRQVLDFSELFHIKIENTLVLF